jgi:hypothetical protein
VVERPCPVRALSVNRSCRALLAAWRCPFCRGKTAGKEVPPLPWRIGAEGAHRANAQQSDAYSDGFQPGIPGSSALLVQLESGRRGTNLWVHCVFRL